MRHAPLIVGFALVLATGLAHAVVYMWTDASGRVQYSDRPPKDFKGPVKRIDIDEDPPPPQAPAAVPAKDKSVSKEAPTPSGKSAVADKRRADRERLQADLDAAREKLAEARKALTEGQDPKSDELQIVQRPAADPNGSPMPGLVPAGTRANCRQYQQPDGKKNTVCPVSMPNEAYFDRVSKLEEAVKKAEDDLADAERAYRRGVD